MEDATSGVAFHYINPEHMEHIKTVYGVLAYEEIIGRYLAQTSKFEGPSCFPVEINFSAGNTTEPPVISISVCSIENDGTTRPLFESGVDQNTSLNSFLDSLNELATVADMIVESMTEGIPYEQVAGDRYKQNHPQPDYENSDLPF